MNHRLMTMEEYTKRKLEVLNISARQIVQLHKMSKVKRAVAIMKATGSDYLAERYDGDFAHRYLNCGSDNQMLWLKMFGIEQTHDNAYALKEAMLFFYNNALTELFEEEGLKRSKINPFGCGENWCKLWITLTDANKQHVVKYF